MKSNILGLRTVIYHVNDIQKAAEWYSKAFGTEPYFDEPFYVGFNIQGYELGLQPENKPVKNKTENVVAYWGVEQIPFEYQRLIDLGAEAHSAPEEVGSGIFVATVKDPFGNILGLICNPHFKLPKA
ncbi:MAG: VOC family protein [Bacteroidia bacterium]